MQQGIMETIRWMRVTGDTILGIGVVVLGWFVLGIKTGWSLTRHPDEITKQFPESLVVDESPERI
jgi:nitric oxide reductase subunit B